METVIIEKKSFEAILSRVENCARRVAELKARLGSGKLGKWYDNQDVCTILRISPRTLQTLRSDKRLPYTRKGGKLWYKAGDVERLIDGASPTYNI